MKGGAAVSEVLAELMRSASERGADIVTLRAIAEEAGELGATRALTRLGLADEGAAGDVKELRELLRSWRDAKRSVWKAVWGWFTRLVVTAVLAGIAVRVGAWWK
jgi:hypothetical protein